MMAKKLASALFAVLILVPQAQGMKKDKNKGEVKIIVKKNTKFKDHKWDEDVKKIYFKEYTSFSPKEFSSIQQKCPNLEKLKFWSTGKNLAGKNLWNDQTSTFTQLKKLVVNGADKTALNTMFKKCPNLEFFSKSLGRGIYELDSADFASTEWDKLKKLKTLRLFGLFANIDDINTILGKIPSLKILICKNLARELSAKLKENTSDTWKKLKELHLISCNCLDEDSLETILQLCTKEDGTIGLKVFNINGFGDPKPSNFDWKKFTKLESLDLSYCRKLYSIDEIKNIIAACPKIKLITINDCSINDFEKNEIKKNVKKNVKIIAAKSGGVDCIKIKITNPQQEKIKKVKIKTIPQEEEIKKVEIKTIPQEEEIKKKEIKTIPQEEVVEEKLTENLEIPNITNTNPQQEKIKDYLLSFVGSLYFGLLVPTFTKNFWMDTFMAPIIAGISAHKKVQIAPNTLNLSSKQNPWTNSAFRFTGAAIGKLLQKYIVWGITKVTSSPRRKIDTLKNPW